MILFYRRTCLIFLLATLTSGLIGCEIDSVNEGSDVDNGPAVTAIMVPAYDQGSMFRNFLSEEISNRRKEKAREKALREAATDLEREELRARWERQEAFAKAFEKSRQENASVAELMRMREKIPKVLGAGLKVSVTGRPSLTDSLFQAAEGDTALINDYRVIVVREGLHKGNDYVVHEASLKNTN